MCQMRTETVIIVLDVWINELETRVFESFGVVVLYGGLVSSTLSDRF